MTLEGVTNLAVSTVCEASKRIYRPVRKNAAMNNSIRIHGGEKHFCVESLLLLECKLPIANMYSYLMAKLFESLKCLGTTQCLNNDKLPIWLVKKKA